MKRCILVACLLLILNGTLARVEPSELPASTNLCVDLIAQQNGNWCWAACAQMIMKAVGGDDVSQCEQAKNYTTNCIACSEQTCDVTGWPEFWKYQYDSPILTDTVCLAWSDVQNQIAIQHKPFAWAYRIFNVCNSHMVVATGYLTTSNQWRGILFNDPWPMETGDRFIGSYDAYSQGMLRGAHWRHYVGITKSEVHVASVHRPSCYRGADPAVSTNVATLAEIEHALKETQALSILREVAAAGHARYLGFSDVPDLNDLTHELPFRLAVATESRGGAGPLDADISNASLPSYQQYFIPIRSKRTGQVLSSVTLMQQGGRWQLIAMGEGAVSRLCQKSRMQSLESHPVQKDARDAVPFSLVTVPAGINHQLIAYDSKDGLLLAPLLDDPSLHWKAGVPVPAQSAFRTLSRIQIDEHGVR